MSLVYGAKTKLQDDLMEKRKFNISVFIVGFEKVFDSKKWPELEAHSKARKAFKMKLFVKLVNSWKTIAIFPKSTISDVWHGFQYSFGDYFTY